MSDTTTDRPHCEHCREEILEALYQLNIIAKEYGRDAANAYESGFKTSARIKSQRKKALYSLKKEALTAFVANGCPTAVETHEIEGRTYYCFTVGDYSYHSPVTEWDEPPADAPAEATVLESFTSSPREREDKMEETEALTRLTQQFSSPNDHLPSPFTSSGYRHEFVGWDSLPEALAVGDRVPEAHLNDHNRREFVFEVDDAFDTSEGRCEIRDRYYAYKESEYGDTLLQRQVYDVVIDGERQEAVTHRRLDSNYHIIADSVTDPLPDVDGKLSDRAGSQLRDTDDEVEFQIGCILELERNDDNQPTYCQLTEVHVADSLLIGQYDPVPPSETAPLGLSLAEIAPRVVATHDADTELID